MAPVNDIPVGYKFHPRDEELVGYYLHNKVRGAPFRDENVIPNIDLYGSMEARDIWNNNGGQDLGDDEDLYFFTKLKPASTKGTGSRVARAIGSGTWHGQNRGSEVKDPKTKKTIGWWKRFTYANTKYPQENGCWIMHEFRLDRKLAMRIKSNSRISDGDEYVVCRVRKNYDRKRKADDNEETRVVESQRNKIQRQFENIDESYATTLSSEVVDKVNTDHCPQQQQPQQEQQTNLNANSTSSSIGVTNVDQRKYDYYEDHPKYYEPQSSHVSLISSVVVEVNVDPYYNQQQLELCNVTEFPQYYYDSQEPMARPDDFVAEASCPTMPSSLGMANQEEYLQHNGFVSNGTDLPQYDYSSTQDPSSGTVFCHYDPPQTATIGFTNQPHHIATQDQPNYFVADPTVASSFASPANIDQNHQIMSDKNQHPLLNFDYSQFYEADGDDIMIDLDDLWNNMVQPAAVL